MGWTYTHRPKGMTDLDWFSREFGEKFKSKVKASASKNNTFYAAYETDSDKLVPSLDGKKYCCIVILFKWVPKDRNYNFGWKDLDEFSGPNEAECPMKILRLLSPLRLDLLEADLKLKAEAEAQGEFYYSGITSAHQWREACRNTFKQQADMTPGAIFKSDVPIKFSDKAEGTTFTVVSKAGRTITWMREDGVRVKLSRDIIRSLKATSRVTSASRPSQLLN